MAMMFQDALRRLKLVMKVGFQIEDAFFFSSRRRHTRCLSDWSSDVCSSDLPGGIIEDGETPEQCIKREMLEEIELPLHKPVLFKRYDFPDRIENMFWQRVDLDITQTPLHEGQKMQWFTAGDLAAMNDDMFAFNFRTLLLQFFSANPFG